MGVGRFAFTPMFPSMVRDGLLNNENGTLPAAGNYLGYLLGAMPVGRIKIKPSFLLVLWLGRHGRGHRSGWLDIFRLHLD
jgi:hypothetical protein